MNKTIFEIAALAFCVSVVLFGVQGFSLVDTISRSFLVFVGVVVLIIIGLSAALVVVDKVRASHEKKGEEQAPVKKEYSAIGKNAQTVIR